MFGGGIYSFTLVGAVVIITFLNHAGPAKVFDIVFFFSTL